MNPKEKFIPPKNKNDMTGVLKSLIKNKQVGVFIDSANLYYAANKASLKIDYFQLSRWFKSHCSLTSLNFYTAYDPLDERQNDFFNDLENSGYSLVKKPIRVFADSVKGNMDIELAVDVLMQKDQYETLVLISGDGDFQRLIQALDQLGKKTIILGVGGFTSYELHQEADNYFFLNRVQEIWKKPQQRTASKDVHLPSKLSKEDKDDLDETDTSEKLSKTSITARPPNRRVPKAPTKKPSPKSSSEDRSKPTLDLNNSTYPEVSVKLPVNTTPSKPAKQSPSNKEWRRDSNSTQSTDSKNTQRTHNTNKAPEQPKVRTQHPHQKANQSQTAVQKSNQNYTDSTQRPPRVKVKIDPDSIPKIILD